MNELWPDMEENDREFRAEHGAAIRSAQFRRAGCPSAQLIVASRGESLPEAVQISVVSHLAHCTSCHMIAEGLEPGEASELTAQERSRMGARLASVMSVGSGSGSWFSLKSWVLRPVTAALLAVLVLAGASLLLLHKEQTLKTATVPQRVPVSLSASALPLEKPLVSIPPDSGLIWRGGVADSSKYTSRLEAALTLYKKDDFVGAAGKLDQLEKRYPDKPEVKFYDGICRLFLGDSAGAVRELEGAQQLRPPTAFQEATTWYLAVAYQRAGQPERASAMLQELCQQGGSYAARACQAAGGLSSH